MHKLVVDANKKGLRLNLKELFQYKDLFLILAYRDLRVRYAQTALGLVWVFIQPLATLLIFIMVFGRAIKVDTGDVPYPLFAISGMAAWSYFAFVLAQAGDSIISAQEMVKKIYFPRLVIPLSKAVVGLVDFSIGLFLVLILMIIYGFTPSINIIYFPLFLIMAMISALAVGIWMSALTIRYRDFKHVVPFLVQFGLYATPVGYPSSLVMNNLPDWANILYYANPMVGVIEGFRWTLLGQQPPSAYSLISFSIIIILFISSLFYFKKVERIMADVV
ncbi:ABC transporter permease [Fulvivirga sediminis]|uniref:Transport permease protein n=1 Tax=Fulvivirga sediminis TaxID=2803949 RepID=A0A937F626_9BACT|nr:ABC transporter permease [Fulvivirga sediminis]MBL3654975.1 ABC transporter permease [Fulvivirga sediminis]